MILEYLLIIVYQFLFIYLTNSILFSIYFFPGQLNAKQRAKASADIELVDKSDCFWISIDPLSRS